MTMSEAPWPLVSECYRHPDGGSCLQCDGSHHHQWLAWHTAPQVAQGISLVDKSSGPGLAVRCRVCGGRKCDVPACTGRRHHSDAHTLLTGEVYAIGEAK